MSDVTSQTISFRVPADKRALIYHAVEVSGIKRSEFILEAVCEKAFGVLAGQVHFELDRQMLPRFNALLDAPLSDNVANQRLLATRAPWER